MSLKAITTRLPRIQLPEKLKGTIVERWAKYWRGLARDYQDVAVESFKKMKEKPLKSSVYGSIAVFLYGCAKTNPDRRDFTDQLQHAQGLVALVTPDLQNPKTVEYLKMVERSRNNDTLRIMSIGFFSIMWLDDKASSLSTFDAKCDYLQPELATFHERIIDIGWLNKWWNLNKKLKDYDVNY